MFDKLKNKLSSSSLSSSEECHSVPSGSGPTVRSIYDSRSNFGVNLGSLFVQEKFIFDKLFIDNTGVELDAVKALVKSKGGDGAKKEYENHWSSYLDDNDWKWMKDHGVQSIRIPIGYWAFLQNCHGKTSFDSVKDVYTNAWKIYKEKYIEKANQYKISILVDLHAVPKGANTGDHSGEKLSQAGFWNDSDSQKITCDILKFIANDLNICKYENISGLQIVNESEFSNDAHHQRKYYTHAIKAIRSVNDHIPIVISDGWWPNQWSKWLNDVNGNGEKDYGIVLDTHIYRCFSDDDKKKSVDQIINDLNKDVLNDVEYPIDVLIGEYSCVLDTQSWDKTNGNRDEMVKRYGNALSSIFQKRALAGSYFWCLKFQHGDGGEWGFKPMVDRGCIPSRKTNRGVPTKEDFDRFVNDSFSQHEKYWNEANSKEKYEHWRYKEGLTTGWADAVEFWKFENSTIGRLQAWLTKRRAEHINARGNSRFLWEWEQGYRAAVDYFRNMN